MIHLDTNVVVWLYIGDRRALSASAARRVDRDDASLSPMVLLELSYLHEIGRLLPTAAEVVEHLAQTIGLRVAAEPFADVVRAAQQHTWTRDPFDRLIVGQADAAGCPLVTADRTILDNYADALW